MNIFYVDRDPSTAAQMMLDRHVVKMILESAQLLSTAHRMLDGTPYFDKTKNGRKLKRWRLDDPDADKIVYQATHMNHPSAMWVRESAANYNWLYNHFCGLMDEYTYRYEKVHACVKMIPYLRHAPYNIKHSPFTDPPPAMDKKYIVSQDAVENYRNYYKEGKSHIHAWTKRPVPTWIY